MHVLKGLALLRVRQSGEIAQVGSRRLRATHAAAPFVSRTLLSQQSKQHICSPNSQRGYGFSIC
jgi:hypothetical protein